MSSFKKNIIIGCTGSVASIKVPILAEILMSSGYNVTIVPTRNSLHFLKTQAAADNEAVHIHGQSTDDLESEVKSLYPELHFIADNDEWNSWQKRGDPVQHIELRKWADLLLVAPLDAHTLAKIAQGLCDNLLTCIVRAWDMSKPLLFCPAMNIHMYLHPFTSAHINILKSLGYKEIGVASKTLMCGDKGLGAMAEVDVIIQEVKSILDND